MNSIILLGSPSVCYCVKTCFSNMFSLEERILTLIVLLQKENILTFISLEVGDSDSLSGILKSR